MNIIDAVHMTTNYGNHSMLTASNIIKEARLKCGLTQKKFAKRLGKAQSEISKYERGSVDPPGSIIIHCMNIIEGNKHLLASPSVESIIERLKKGFDSPHHALARSLIMTIILNEEQKS